MEADLRWELTGTLESVIGGLVMPPLQYLTRRLSKSISANDLNPVFEMLIPRSDKELQELSVVYRTGG
jgi:hypothetical protein